MKLHKWKPDDDLNPYKERAIVMLMGATDVVRGIVQLTTLGKYTFSGTRDILMNDNLFDWAEK